MQTQKVVVKSIHSIGWRSYDNKILLQIDVFISAVLCYFHGNKVDYGTV